LLAVDLRTGCQVVRTRLDGRTGRRFLVDARIERRMHDRSFKRKRRIGDRDGRMAEVEVEHRGDGNQENADNQAENEFH
jgi:hypothetical protein